MEPISAYQDFISKLNRKYGNTERIVGLLFAAPANDLFGKRFYVMFDYYHIRTGDTIDFFCPGYTTDLNEHYIKIHNFDYYNYGSFIREFEYNTNWRYNGGTNLLFIPYQNGKLNFKTVYDLNFTRMYIDGLIDDYYRFIEELIRNISDLQKHLFSENMNLQGNKLWHNFSEFLPKFISRIIKQFSDSYKINEHLKLHDITKNEY